MDRQLRPAPRLSARFALDRHLDYFTTGENRDYLANEVLVLRYHEAEAAIDAGDALYALLRKTALRSLDDPRRRAELGVTEAMRPLLDWSVTHEWDDFYCGRFDFAGGLDDLPLSLLEFNADTCSLIPETIELQPELLRMAGVNPAPNTLVEALQKRASHLRSELPNEAIIGSHLGYEEDRINLEALLRPFGKPALSAMPLPSVHFDPENGLLLELGPERFLRYDLLVKYFPWDWIGHEEPELWQLLTELITTRRLRVLNPAWAMLLQSKALLVHAYQDEPLHPLLLPAAFHREDLPDPHVGYVRKPIFGRTGDNLLLTLDGQTTTAELGGDYGHQPVIFQELAAFGMDVQHHRYQLSTFQAPHACALCCRRQDDFILDDDAEFVGVGVV